MQLYVEEYETRLIEATGRYYLKESNKCIEEMNITEFITKALLRFKDEKVRIDAFCHESSREKMTIEFTKSYIAVHKSTLENDFKKMMATEDIESTCKY